MTKFGNVCRFSNIALKSKTVLRIRDAHFHSSSKLLEKSSTESQSDDIRTQTEPSSTWNVHDYPDAQLQELCDISRLPRQLQAKMNHREELMPPSTKEAASIEKQRAIYARLGKKSGLPPGIMWPTKSQIRATVHDENTYFATLQEMIKVVNDRKVKEEEDLTKLQEDITEAMKGMPTLISDFEAKIQAKKEEERASLRAKQEMLDEAQEFFGYAISEKDERIVKFLEQKEQAEVERQKSERKAKKAAEAKAHLEELARKAAEEALKAAALVQNDS